MHLALLRLNARHVTVPVSGAASASATARCAEYYGGSECITFGHLHRVAGSVIPLDVSIELCRGIIHAAREQAVV